jgi:hypothetical protein
MHGRIIMSDERYLDEKTREIERERGEYFRDK